MGKLKLGEKIAGKLLGAAKPRVDMGLGSAFEQINEPLEQLNAPRNKAVEAASKLLGKQLDISGGKVPGMAEQNAQVLQTIGDVVVPASQDILGSSVAKVMKAVKPAGKIAAQMANKPLSAAERLAAKAPNEVLVLGDTTKPMNFGTVYNKPDKVQKTGWTQTPDIAADVYKKDVESAASAPRSNDTMERIVEKYKSIKSD